MIKARHVVAFDRERWNETQRSENVKSLDDRGKTEPPAAAGESCGLPVKEAQHQLGKRQTEATLECCCSATFKVCGYSTDLHTGQLS